MDFPIQPIPLNGAELHLRLILQSLADQISEKWNGNDHPKQIMGESSHSDQNELRLSSPNAPSHATYKMAVAGRDFMVIRIPSHELSDSEAMEMVGAANEARTVIGEWEMRGGLWVNDGATRRWVGVENPPAA